MNFLTSEMTSLRYFLPLILEGNRRGINSKLFITQDGCHKNNYILAHEDQLKQLAEQYKFEILDVAEIKDHNGIAFVIEDASINYLHPSLHTICSLTYMSDFSLQYEKYVDKTEHVIFPSQFMAGYFNTISDKNLYLGSPKYDVKLNKSDICNKYNLEHNTKKAVVFLAKKRDASKIDLPLIYEYLNDIGFDVLTKTRGKDPYDRKYHADRYFEDASWYPHTSLELLAISDLAINFSSTVIKECVMLNTPLINFHIKPFKKPLDFLYNYDYCVNYAEGEFPDVHEFKRVVQFLISKNLQSEFDLSIKNHLFEKGNVAAKILDFLLDQL